MQVKLVGGGSFYGPHGVMLSYPPGAIIDVDTGDKVAVAYWQDRVDAGAAELVEAPSATVTKAAAKAAAKAEAQAEAEANEPPPRAGAGSSRDAWAAYAESIGVEVTDDMTRDDIADAVDGMS